MKSSKKRQPAVKSGIRANHQAKKGPVLVYLLVFLAVSITMIGLNQKRKNMLRQESNGSTENQSSRTNTLFTKEGELDFVNPAGEAITKIDIEIADDDYQTQKGLMYRRSMKSNQGMLFIFPDEEERSFWMKNTYLPLDILYVNANKEIVSITENASPQSTESIWSKLPAKYVVEVNAGFVAQYRIKEGDQIQFLRK